VFVRPLYPLLLVSLAGCATIMHGTTQDLGISSTPTAATVTVDKMEKGSTPVIAKLSRKDNHTVHIELPGYLPFEATVTRKTSGWVWGNIVFGGLIGLAVDAITGGLYNLTPEQITAQMASSKTTLVVPTGKNQIMVFLVRQPEADWQQIGMLTRE